MLNRIVCVKKQYLKLFNYVAQSVWNVEYTDSTSVEG